MQQWNSSGPGGPSAMATQQMQQQQQLQAQANFEEAIMTSGGVVVVSSGPPVNASPVSNYANNSGGDRRLLASPMGTQIQPGVSYAPRFASTPIYHHNSAGVNPSIQQPSPVNTFFPPNRASQLSATDGNSVE